MKSILETIQHNVSKMTPGAKAAMRRSITGEADNDLLRRGDVLAAIRSLMTNPVPPIDTQVGIKMALERVYALPEPRS